MHNSGAEDDTQRALDLVEKHQITADDVVIAATGSGSTPYTMQAVKFAYAKSALTVVIVNNVNSAIQ
jgi:N-acetylmuramic acid 6-phosphate etherase